MGLKKMYIRQQFYKETIACYCTVRWFWLTGLAAPTPLHMKTMDDMLMVMGSYKMRIILASATIFWCNKNISIFLLKLLFKKICTMKNFVKIGVFNICCGGTAKLIKVNVSSRRQRRIGFTSKKIAEEECNRICLASFCRSSRSFLKLLLRTKIYLYIICQTEDKTWVRRAIIFLGRS